jgi:hypothetical protein
LRAKALRTIRAVVVPLALLVVVATLALRSAPEARALSLNPHLQASLANGTPGAASDLMLDFSIDAPDPIFDSIVTFVPGEMSVLQGDTGASAGTLDADSNLGLFNGACNSFLQVHFDLIEGSTDIQDTIPLYYGYSDYDGNGLPENVDHYPDFLARLAPNIEPVRRLYGQTLVANVETFVNFVVYEPGASIARLPVMDAGLGYPIVVYLNDPTSAPPPYAITDFCSPLGTVTEVYGTSQDNPNTTANESGDALLSNPPNAGTYNVTSFVRSQWDTDGDNVENTLDPCPFSADPGWDPRDAEFSAADPDTDGLPASCDPNSNDLNQDQDGDSYQNRQDKCPLVAGSFPPDYDLDGIADACDPQPEDATNGGVAQRAAVCVTSAVDIGAGGAAPDVACPSGPDVILPPTLLVDPGGEKFRVGTVVSLHAQLSQPLTNAPIPAVNVGFEVTGANPTTGNCTTDNFGGCGFNFAGANLGVDTINASADVGSDHVTKTFTLEWVSPPANDNFADATAIDALPFESELTLVASGAEAAEPHFCGVGDRTVWFEFAPTSDVFMMVEVGNETGNFTSLAVFEGVAIGSSTPISCGYVHFPIPYGGVPRPAKVEVPEAYLFAGLERGKTYHIQVGEAGYGGDDLTFEVSEAMRGDTNCDDLVDGVDILGILKMLASFGDPDCIGAADFDCSRFVSSTDLMSEMKLQAGVWTPSPCSLNPGQF